MKKKIKQHFPNVIVNLIYQKVCADHMNRTVPREEVGRVLEKLGKSMCTMLEFKDLEDIRIKVLDMLSTRKNFHRFSKLRLFF